MNKAGRERVIEIINLFLSYQAKQTALDEIAVSGPTQETKMMEFKGVFPQMSDIKPDILSRKVEKQRKFYISQEEKRANVILSAFPYKFQKVLIAYEKNKNKHNPITQKPWTHNDVATLLRFRLERYKAIRAHLFSLVLEVDKSQDVQSSKTTMHNILKNVVA